MTISSVHIHLYTFCCWTAYAWWLATLDIMSVCACVDENVMHVYRLFSLVFISPCSFTCTSSNENKNWKLHDNNYVDVRFQYDVIFFIFFFLPSFVLENRVAVSGAVQCVVYTGCVESGKQTDTYLILTLNGNIQVVLCRVHIDVVIWIRF